MGNPGAPQPSAGTRDVETKPHDVLVSEHRAAARCTRAHRIASASTRTGDIGDKGRYSCA